MDTRSRGSKARAGAQQASYTIYHKCIRVDETVSVRIPSDVLRDLEGLSKLAHESRSDLLRDVLHKGLERKKLEVAIGAYRSGQVSLGRAREMADVPLHQLLDEFRRAGVLQNYDLAGLRADLEWAERR